VILWLDAQISPHLCPWIAGRFAVEVEHIRDLGLREAEDQKIFNRARDAQAVLFTKDEDFVELVRRRATPPQVLWLRCGNMSNSRLKRLLLGTLPDAIELLRQGEPIVEIGLAESVRGGGTKRSARPRPRGRSGGQVASRSRRGG
jgi:predicted nuclease of predicted toxin-antitoxin system